VKIKDLEDNFRLWLVDVTGEEAIWENQNAPRGALDFENGYYGLFTSDFGKEGQDAYSLSSDEDGDTEIKGDRSFIIDVNYYGVNAFQKCINIQDFSESFSALNKLREFGIVLYDTADPMPLPTVLGSRFEERALIRLNLRVGHVRKENTGYFNKLKINGSVNSQDLHIETEES